MSKKIETFEFPEGSGKKWQVALSTRWGTTTIMIRSDKDADEHSLDYWRPILDPSFVSRVEEIAQSLTPLGKAQQMEDARL